MLWIFLGLILAVVFGIVISVNDYATFWEGVGNTCLLILLFVMPATLLGAVSSEIADEYAAKTYYVEEDIDIYALQDNLTTDGRFFLGSGHIDDELKYFYVQKTDVGYTVRNVDADESYIQYTSDRCHLEKQAYHFDNWFIDWIAFPKGYRYVFYIPDGSIINNYAIDLK